MFSAFILYILIPYASSNAVNTYKKALKIMSFFVFLEYLNWGAIFLVSVLFYPDEFIVMVYALLYYGGYLARFMIYITVLRFSYEKFNLVLYIIYGIIASIIVGVITSLIRYFVYLFIG